MGEQTSAALERFKRYLRGEMTDKEKREYENIYCVCVACIQCGCGEWEKHHNNLMEVKRR